MFDSDVDQGILYCNSGKGKFSCFHGEQRPSPPADRHAVFKHTSDATRIIMKYYDEASSRLPLEEMPDLAGWIYAAGHCYGVADPVTNIILNAIAMLLSGEHTPEARDSYQMATRSYTGLCAFMAAYFRHLSSMQARRYLRLARFSLPVAVMLVHYDRAADGGHGSPSDFVARHPFLPDGGQAKAAFRTAARQAEHPAPHVLAGAMTAQYPASLLGPAMSKLQRGKLSAQDVQEIKDLLSRQWPPSDPPPAAIGLWCRPDGVRCTRRGKDELLIPVCLGNGVVARVLIQIGGGGDDLHDEPLKYITDEVAKPSLSHCFCVAVDGSREEEKPDSHGDGVAQVDYDDRPCEYARFLKMSMLETIHSRYIEALSVLPTGAWTPRFIRALLIAGHCYGPMDPVANIIVSTIWYDVVLGVDVELPKEILGTKPLSRIVSRSLDGLVAIWNSSFMSEHASLCSIYHHGCSSGQFLGQHSEPGSSSRRALLVAAAMAAKHPQHPEFASFLASLNASRLESLLSRRDARISDDNWDLLTSFIREEAAQHAVAAHAPIMNAFGLLSSYGDKLNFLRAELKKLLRDYCYKHPWEPSYHLDIICGVMEKTASYHKPTLYHAKFLARLEDVAENHDSVPSDPPRTLFFAEFWGPNSFGEDAGPKLSSCSRVHPSCIGRCSLCECEASMIIHPPSGGHSGDIDGSVDVYDHAVQKLEFGFEGSLGTDIVYCDHNRYVRKEFPVNAPMDFPWGVPKDLPGTSFRASFERQKPVKRLTPTEYLTLGASSMPLGSRTFSGASNLWECHFS